MFKIKAFIYYMALFLATGAVGMEKHGFIPNISPKQTIGPLESKIVFVKIIKAPKLLLFSN